MLTERVQKSEKFQTTVFFIVVSIIWGSSFILIKKGLVVFSPMQVATIRIFFASLFLFPIALKNLKKIPEGKTKYFIIAGILGNLIPAILFAMAQTKLNSSLSGILNALTPLFTLLFAVFVFKIKVSGFQIFGIVLGFAGIIALSLLNSKGDFGDFNVYVWLIVVATIFYALNLIIIKIHFSNIKSIIATSLSLFFIGPVSLFYLFTSDFFYKMSNVPGAYESLFFVSLLGILGTAIALALYMRLIQLNNAIFASSVAYLIPIVAILWGLLDGEVLYPMHYAGMAMILTGIYFSNKT